MVEQNGFPAPIELRLRDLHVRAWLAALHETASHLVRGDIHNGRLCVYSIANCQSLIIMDWCYRLVTVRVPGEPEGDSFSGVQGALAFLDGVVEHHVAQAQANSHHPPRFERSRDKPVEVR